MKSKVKPLTVNFLSVGMFQVELICF